LDNKYRSGHNEELIRIALANRRDKVIVATKFDFGPNWEFVGDHPDYVKNGIFFMEP
jgi:aryl-alcohol dehydrogenase-like predicted oxidoreductase